MFISSADWMTRNLDHRVEATCPVLDEGIRKELRDIIDIQLKDNVKARWLNNQMNNEYAQANGVRVRSQEETYNYLQSKITQQVEASSH